MMICYDVNVHRVKRKTMHRGFTLLELLIVIVVIGILSAMLMLSASNIATSADATNIINNLKHMKTATMEWYTDNIDKITPDGYVIVNGSEYDGNIKGRKNNFADFIHATDIAPYLDGQFKTDEIPYGVSSIQDGSDYIYFTAHKENSDKTLTWLVGCHMPINNHRLKEKLESRAGSTGLLYFKNGTLGRYTADSMRGQGAGLDMNVYMEVMNFSKN